MTGHDLEGVTEDHAVRPVLVVLVELSPVNSIWNTVEVGEEVGLCSDGLRLCFFCLPKEIVDQYLRMNLFLNVERRGVDNEIAPVLLILPTPDKLGVEIGVPWILHRPWRGIVWSEHGLMLGRWNVLPLGLVVRDCFDGLASAAPLGHS